MPPPAGNTSVGDLETRGTMGIGLRPRPRAPRPYQGPALRLLQPPYPSRLPRALPTSGPAYLGPCLPLAPPTHNPLASDSTHQEPACLGPWATRSSASPRLRPPETPYPSGHLASGPEAAVGRRGGRKMSLVRSRRPLTSGCAGGSARSTAQNGTCNGATAATGPAAGGRAWLSRGAVMRMARER